VLTPRVGVAHSWPFRYLSASAAAAIVGVPASAGRAHAEPAPSEHIALVYQAPPECPGDEAFRNEVRSRVASDWEAQPGELARRVSVNVAQSGDRYLASIDFLDPQGNHVARSVSGTQCADVVNGIALVTALAIQARVEEALAQSEPEVSRAPDLPSTKAPAPSPAKLAATAKSEPPAKRAAEPKNPAPTKPRTHVRFGASAAVGTGVGPDLALGPAVFAALEWNGPRLGLTGTALFSGRVQAHDLPARFRRLAARLEGCPVSWTVDNLGFEPCVFFEFGSLRGDADTTSPSLLQSPTGGASPWLAPGALARLVTSFEPLVIVLEVNAGVPLVRETFGLLTSRGKDTKFRVGPVVVGGSLGLGVRL
jgi:hypothetical protein